MTRVLLNFTQQLSISIKLADAFSSSITTIAFVWNREHMNQFED